MTLAAECTALQPAMQLQQHVERYVTSTCSPRTPCDEVYVSSVGLGGATVVYKDPSTAGVRFNVRF